MTLSWWDVWRRIFSCFLSGREESLTCNLALPPPAKSCIPHSSLLPLIHISPLTSLCPTAAGIDAQISISINPQQTWGHPSQIVDLSTVSSSHYNLWHHWNSGFITSPASFPLINGRIYHLLLHLQSWWRWTHLRSCHRESWSYEATVEHENIAAGPPDRWFSLSPELWGFTGKFAVMEPIKIVSYDKVPPRSSIRWLLLLTPSRHTTSTASCH